METQKFENHTRWHPPFHFFVMPVMLINFFWAAVLFVKSPNANSAWWVVVSIALAVLTLLVRVNSLRVQDRLIRLEERLRYQQLLPGEVMRQAYSFSPGQVCALRFASDEELLELASQVAGGQLTKPRDIKRAVKDWRADTFRV
jgi:hypothetical protein